MRLMVFLTANGGTDRSDGQDNGIFIEVDTVDGASGQNTNGPRVHLGVLRTYAKSYVQAIQTGLILLLQWILLVA